MEQREDRGTGNDHLYRRKKTQRDIRTASRQYWGWWNLGAPRDVRDVAWSPSTLSCYTDHSLLWEAVQMSWWQPSCFGPRKCCCLCSPGCGTAVPSGEFLRVGCVHFGANTQLFIPIPQLSSYLRSLRNSQKQVAGLLSIIDPRHNCNFRHSSYWILNHINAYRFLLVTYLMQFCQDSEVLKSRFFCISQLFSPRTEVYPCSFSPICWFNENTGDFFQ